MWSNRERGAGSQRGTPAEPAQALSQSGRNQLGGSQHVQQATGATSQQSSRGSSFGLKSGWKKLFGPQRSARHEEAIRQQLAQQGLSSLQAEVLALSSAGNTTRRICVVPVVDDNAHEREDDDFNREVEQALQESLRYTDPSGKTKPESDGRDWARAATQHFFLHRRLLSNHRIGSGFYAVFGDFAEVADRTDLPRLSQLRRCRPGLEGREVLEVDLATDTKLQAFLQDVREAMEGVDVRDALRRATVAAHMVAERLGGSSSDGALAREYASESTAMQLTHDSPVLPLGALQLGLSRHRALLLKAALQTVNIASSLGPARGGGDAFTFAVEDGERTYPIALYYGQPARPSRSGSVDGALPRVASGADPLTASGAAVPRPSLPLPAHTAAPSSSGEPSAPPTGHVPPVLANSASNPFATPAPPVKVQATRWPFTDGALLRAAFERGALPRPGHDMRTSQQRSSGARHVSDRGGAGSEGAPSAPGASNSFMGSSGVGEVVASPLIGDRDRMESRASLRSTVDGRLWSAHGDSRSDVEELDALGRKPSGVSSERAGRAERMSRTSSRVPRDAGDRPLIDGAARPLPPRATAAALVSAFGGDDGSSATPPRSRGVTRSGSGSGSRPDAPQRPHGVVQPLSGAFGSAPGESKSRDSLGSDRGPSLRADGSVPAPSGRTSAQTSSSEVAASSQRRSHASDTRYTSSTRPASGAYPPHGRDLEQAGPSPAPNTGALLASAFAGDSDDEAGAGPQATHAAALPERPAGVPWSAHLVSAFGGDDEDASGGGGGNGTGGGGKASARRSPSPAKGISGVSLHARAGASSAPAAGASAAAAAPRAAGLATAFGDDSETEEETSAAAPAADAEAAAWAAVRGGSASKTVRTAPPRRAHVPSAFDSAGSDGGASDAPRATQGRSGDVSQSGRRADSNPSTASTATVTPRVSHVDATESAVYKTAAHTRTGSALSAQATAILTLDAEDLSLNARTDRKRSSVEEDDSARPDASQRTESELGSPMSMDMNAGRTTNLRSALAMQSLQTIESRFRMWINPNDIVMTDEVIGSGNYGQVMLAKFRTERCAVKQILCATEEEYTASMREMLLMQELQFDKIVRFFGAIKRSKRCLWICMEFMPFSDLRKILHSPKHRQECRFPDALLTLQRRIKWAKDVVAALDLLHSRNVVHRDLKPGNILISNRYDAVLSDFGLSRGLAQQSRLQASGPGTVSYAAPEALFSNEVSPSSDMFSFGCVLWELLSLKEPWAELGGGAVFQVMSKVIHDKASLQVGDIPEAVRERLPTVILALTRCFSYDPRRRPTAFEMYEVLEDALEATTD